MKRNEIRRLRQRFKKEIIEDYEVMNECCYFHTKDEFSSFSNEEDFFED